jgi:dihydroxyacetone kinase
VSLTLLWLDDDLERLWGAPADAPAFRKCSVDHTAATVEFAEVEESAVLTATASEESRAGSARVVEIFGTIAQTIDEHADELGRAEVGDKTLVDVLVPFDETLTEAVECGASFVEAWQQATAAAAHAAEGTKDLLPRMGRARPHDAERSLGTPDAGAVSLSLIVDAIGKVLPVEPATKVSI